MVVIDERVNNMNTLIEINTKRLAIKQFTPKYLTEEYVSWLNDREVVRYSEQRHKSHTLASCSDYYKSFQDKCDLFLVILTKDQPINHIGNITVLIDTNNLVADIAIVIGKKDVWGKGYGKEAFAGVMDYLFLKKNIRKVTAGTMSINKPMLSIMKSSGMVSDGVKKNQFLVDGEEVDMIMAAAWSSSK